MPKTILAMFLPLYFSGFFLILDKLTTLKIKERPTPIPKVKGERIKAIKHATLNGSWTFFLDISSDLNTGLGVSVLEISNSELVLSQTSFVKELFLVCSTTFSVEIVVFIIAVSGVGSISKDWVFVTVEFLINWIDYLEQEITKQ